MSFQNNSLGLVRFWKYIRVSVQAGCNIPVKTPPESCGRNLMVRWISVFSWNKSVGTLFFGLLLEPESGHKILSMASPTYPVGITGRVEMFIVNCRLLLSTTDWDRLATMAERNCSSEVPKDGLDNMFMRHFDTVIFFRGHWTEELILLASSHAWRSNS